MRVRTVQRAKQIGRTGKAIIKTSAVAGMRQMRCMGCGQMAGEVTMPDGKKVYECQACRRQFTCTKF